jgi:cell division protein FtsN
MSWSRLDILTAVIVFFCMGVLGLLVYKLVGAMNEDDVREKPQVEVSDDRPEEEEEVVDSSVGSDSSAYLDEIGMLEEDLDDPAMADAEAGIAEEEVVQAKQEKTWPAERPKTASVPSASRAVADRSTSVSSSSSTASAEKTTAAPAASPTKTGPRPAPVTIGPRAGAGGIYKVIAGAFKSRVNADSQASQLRQLGYAQTRVLSGDNGIYRVMVQSFDNSADAARLERELESKGFGDCYVKAN